jgi:hypothetical protein
MDRKAMETYAKSQENPVNDDLTDKNYYTIIRENLVNSDITVKDNSDSLVRSLIRHDSNKLALLLKKISENGV